MGSMENLQMTGSTILPSMGVLNQMHNQAEQNKPRSRNMKKGSWAPETNLCQVFIFSLPCLLQLKEHEFYELHAFFIGA